MEQKLINFTSNEKNWHQLPDYKNLGNVRSPALIIITNGVNCGKSKIAKNIVSFKEPRYERIVVYSPMADESSEYAEDINCEMVDCIPTFDFFDKSERSLFICEDIDTKSLQQDEKSRLIQFFSFIGTHKQVDTIIISQIVCDIEPKIRRLAYYLFLFGNHDQEHMSKIAKKCNLTVKQIKYIFNNICTEFTDCILIDETRTPDYKFRKTLFEVIKIPQI